MVQSTIRAIDFSLYPWVGPIEKSLLVSSWWGDLSLGQLGRPAHAPNK